jgi:hypothetical protein
VGTDEVVELLRIPGEDRGDFLCFPASAGNFQCLLRWFLMPLLL